MRFVTIGLCCPGLFYLVLAGGGAAVAGDKPIYAPAPAWVTPAPAIEASKLGDDAPVILLFDNQQRIAPGEEWSYVDRATRVATPELLGQLGTVQLPWQPAHGDLIVHRAEIIRGDQHIDLLKGGDPARGGALTVLRREQALDQRMLDGVLTATMTVEGLRVGDVLHLAYSITTRDPTLKGNVQMVAPLIVEPQRVGFARVRLSWPATLDVHWKAFAQGVGAEPVTDGGWRDLTVKLPLPKQSDLPRDAPLRFQHLPIIEASSFAGWDAVVGVMAPLFATDGTIAPGSPLAQEVARIVAADPDPLKRAAAALQLVQDKVRYQLMGMNTGNYVPQPPALTWAARYGDCKAKTLLLLAMLHAMAIDAEPVLANLQLGDVVADRVPSLAAFDHVLVRATVGGETFWLDGTASGTRLADIHDTPPYGFVLPLGNADHPRTHGAALPVRIALHADARPQMTTAIDLDERAGVDLPATFHVVVVFRGGVAELLRGGAAQASKTDLENFAAKAVETLLDSPVIATQKLDFDPAAATARLDVTGISYPDWTRDDGRLVSALDKSVGNIGFSADRARPAWRDLPVIASPPSNIRLTTRIVLPGDGAGFTTEGGQPLALAVANGTLERRIDLAGGTITVAVVQTSSGGEVAAAAIPGMRKLLAQAGANPPRVLAPAALPMLWQRVDLAQRTHRLDPIIAVYRQRIADKPDDASRLTDRAWFLDRIHDRRGAIDDLTHAIAIDPQLDSYLARARAYQALDDDRKALGDARAAHALDAGSDEAIGLLADLEGHSGDRAAALALLQERIDTGGKAKDAFITSKAEIESDGGDAPGAIATLDAAIAHSPATPALFNSRCWIKGTRNLMLDTALKDCTRAIELSDSPVGALDSRAMVYFRMNRLDDALTDLDAALTIAPELAPSLFMRGVVRRRKGDTRGADADLLAARTIDPRTVEQYARYGIKP